VDKQTRVATVLAALALIAAPAAKADLVETFNLSGNFGSFFGPPVAFTGAINLDFSSNFAEETLQSMTITVDGRPVFNLSPSLGLAISASQGIINESNSSGDMLSLTFATPSPGPWAGFNQEAIAGGQVIFGGVTGVLLGATGEVTRDLRQGDTRPFHNRPAAAHNRPADPCRSRALDLGDDAHRLGGPRPRREGPARIGLPARQSLSRVPLRGSVSSGRASPYDLTTSSAFRYSQGALGSRPSGAAFLFRRPHADLERPVSRDITRS
jgi:hypothetical protein